MGTLLANGIWLLDDKDPVEMHVTGGIVAAAASDTIGGDGKGARKPITFYAANQTEKNAIDALHPGGVAYGDQVYLNDTRWYETYGDGGWTVTRTMAPVAYTPTASEFAAELVTIGNGTSNLSYHLSDDRVTVAGLIYLGTTGVLAAEGPCSLPLPFPAALGRVNDRLLGTVAANQAAGGLGHLGSIVGIVNGGSFRAVMLSKRQDQGVSNITQLRGYSNIIPRNWSTATANRFLSVLFTYIRA